MTDKRWTIFRRLMLVVLVGTGLAVAARKDRQPAEPVQTPPPTPVAPALPTAAPLFPDSLPIAALAVPDGLPGLSAQGCNACHFSVHDAWADGPHARAWNSQTYRAALAQVGDTTACTGCHLPVANQHPRLAAGYIQGDIARPDMQPNPAWDPTLMQEGVTCAVCHVRDGKVLTTNSSATAAAHPLALSEELGDSAMCATCHQLTWPEADRPFYDTYGEWEASPQADAGIGCRDCHMPPVAGLATATAFAAQADHGFHADTARALTIEVGLSAPELQRGEPFTMRLRVRNTGAGHHVPTGSPFKGYRLVARLVGEDGKDLVEHWQYDLARELESAPPWNTLSDTRLPAGGELSLEHAFTVDQRKRAGRGQLEVTMWRLDAAARADARWAPPTQEEPLLRQVIPLPVM